MGEPDEGWLLDRMSMRKKAFFNPRDLFPRSPSPQKADAARTAQTVEQQPQMTIEEEQRNEKFQAGIKKAMKEEAKELNKKDKKDKGKGSDDEGKEKKEKKDKKDKKKSKDADESEAEEEEEEED